MPIFFQISLQWCCALEILKNGIPWVKYGLTPSCPQVLSRILGVNNYHQLCEILMAKWQSLSNAMIMSVIWAVRHCHFGTLSSNYDLVALWHFPGKALVCNMLCAFRKCQSVKVSHKITYDGTCAMGKEKTSTMRMRILRIWEFCRAWEFVTRYSVAHCKANSQILILSFGFLKRII